MAISNDEIIQKIKEYRKTKGKTQLDLANFLGKTAAAISDLERGKVQITASDLSKIADFLEIPVSSFFDDFFAEKYVQEMIFLAKHQPAEAREKSITMLNSLMDVQSITFNLETNREKVLTPEEIGNFFTKVLNLSTQFKNMSIQVDSLTQTLYQTLSEQGMPLPKP